MTTFTVLGCSGGIGSGRHTTCYRVDEDILIDAGTGITTLDFDALARIDHVFLTHAHLDHVLGLPLLLDAVGERRTRPVILHALPAVLDIVSSHLFNWKLWPDFRVIPSAEAPWVRFEPVQPAESVQVGTRRFAALPVEHTVPACAWHVSGSTGSLVFSGDTTECPPLVAALNRIPDLRHFIVETSFENALEEIARASKHHWPASLARELARLEIHPQVWITHLKPGNEVEIMRELTAAAPGRGVQALVAGQVLSF